ncbi:MAG: protein GlmU [Desulfobacterales bacterium]|nr:protein GlmU [Desulfobacterales bacterium]MDD4071058.1 protein GlmU [Desulfobacterales bacterium]MDD4392455.1 protein GlmU [Desulfobacterales bacterium]
MDLTLKCYDKIRHLIEKGVSIPNPFTLDIGDEVHVENISGRGVKIYPGCRIYGSKTVISSDTKIGREAPATIEDCQIGAGVELKGGYFNQSVFLEKASMNTGAHVREGCILEEQANTAHTVGLKQTILFPYVTLGSLINFCDCLMSGGTSRSNHSEVGSSYIHFNYTPESDKTTPSLIGDVPRGVMLNQPPIFLGGQGGIVGPIRLGFGNVVGAGTIMRKDSPEDSKLIFGKAYRDSVIDFVPRLYPDLSRMVSNNIIYIANLIALTQWYVHVRKGVMSRLEFGDLLFCGATEKLSAAISERIKRLISMAEKMPDSLEVNTRNSRSAEIKREFHENIHRICEIFRDNACVNSTASHRDRFLSGLNAHLSHIGQMDYLDLIKGLPPDISQSGSHWLNQIVETICRKAASVAPAMNLLS